MSPKKTDPPPEQAGFETTLAKLESLVGKLENNETDLEESLRAFEEGIKLTRAAQKALSDAEQRVQTLLEENGQPISGEISGDEPEA